MASFQVAELKEGVFKDFYDKKSTRINKNKKFESWFEIKLNNVGVYVGKLMDNFGNEEAMVNIPRRVHHKVLESEWFEFDSWDVFCVNPDAVEPPSVIMKNEFKLANRATPYSRPVTPSRRPLINFINRGPVSAADGYFSTYTKIEEMLETKQNSTFVEPNEDEDIHVQCQQCLEVLSVDSSEHWQTCDNAAIDPDKKLQDYQENIFWNKSVVGKTVIPKTRLLDLIEQYKNEKPYIAAVFDGFVLGGHRLEEIHDAEFKEIRRNMRQI